MPWVRGRTGLYKCDNCGLPTRKPMEVTEESHLERLRGKGVCQTYIAAESKRIVREGLVGKE